MKVPWFELHMDDEEIHAVIETMKSVLIGIGPKVKEFEQKLAEYVGVKYAIAVSSGTAALDIALKILGVSSGDEVIVPGMPYIATANCILFQHAIPVFSDIDPNHFGMDPDSAQELVSEKTKGIIPINYGGHSVDWDKLNDLAKNKNLFIVEDGAASFGGEYKNKKLCSFGDISITSFHVAKTFTSVEGGMIFTNNDEFEKKARMIRSHGEDPNNKYWHPVLGHNYRMTDINASIGLVQFSRIEKLLKARESLAKYYTEKLSSIPEIITPSLMDGCKHSWFIYPILVKNRDKVKNILEDKGIGTNVSWPFPAYKQSHLKKYKKTDLPVVERVTSEILGLPMFYKLKTIQQDIVIHELKSSIEESVNS